MPEVAESMQDLSSMLGDIATVQLLPTKEQWENSQHLTKHNQY